jgi:hypothetical protein
MEITKDFLVAEIQSLEQEAQKAQVFIIQAQATISAYKMLLNKLNELMQIISGDEYTKVINMCLKESV